MCWGGFHKCFDHIDDTEIMGVDVKMIRSDYENCVREEFYYCESCDFKSGKMENIKTHFMVNHIKTHRFRCWECDKEVVKISELKQHVGSYHYIPLEEQDYKKKNEIL